MENPRPLQAILEALHQNGTIGKFLPSFKISQIPRGRVLVDQGQVSDMLYFIEKGVMRTYYTRGCEDITSLLIADGGVVCIASSFFSRSPSEEILETLEECLVYTISYQAYRSLTDADHRIAVLTLRLLEQHLIGFGDRVKVFKYLSVDERVRHYIRQEHSLFRRIPDHYIATYLGTTSATFSRAIKNILRE